MATAQKERNSVSAVVFPKTIATEQQSLMLVKRLLAVAVSCITYLRGIFPESAYRTRYMDDVCVKILQEDKKCPGSTQLVKWYVDSSTQAWERCCIQQGALQPLTVLRGSDVDFEGGISHVLSQSEREGKASFTNLEFLNGSFVVKEMERMLGCYDALQKKYLRQIVLAVYTHPEDPQTVTECYHFKFKYTHHGPLLDFGSKDKKSDSTITCADTKKASILLIRKIYVLMQNLSPLPNDVCLTMKLLYYDEVTPPDYQPPGFKEAKYEGLMFNEEPMYLNVGEVPTPFHMLKLKITTEKQRMENVDKSILKQGETAEPLQVCGVSRDDPEEDEDMKEDPVLDNKVEDKNHANISEAQEKNAACDEEAGGIQTPRVSNPQVDHLTRKTSELVVSESRTRSGKIFQSCIVHPPELSSSQDVLPKRRKLSEPKEQF